MSEEKNIINFTASDIEKYWKGKLSPAEMHAIEKAAMNDAFLADAIEGYRNTSLADLDSLKERLDKRVGAVVPILNLKRKRFTWIKAAAAVIIIVGVGLLVQQLVFNDSNKNSIAILEKDDKKPGSVTNKDQKTPDSINEEVSTQSSSVSNKPEQKATTAPKEESYVSSNPDTIKQTNLPNDEYKKRETEKVAEVNAQAIANAEKKEQSVRAKADGKNLNDNLKTLSDDKIHPSPTATRGANRAYDENRRSSETASNNKYNYRVIDDQNNPVPFANVMNTRDNVGTYTDIRGNFNLASSDSILHVQIRSLGYDDANYKLAPSKTQSGDLVLKEDERRATLSQNRKVVSSVSRKDSAELEEPEVGWVNYNTYVANNIHIPENVRSKNTRSDVELSFDVDKSGVPVNIKITRSSQCKKCDEEAIRLLKEGPKWKRKGKKSKATVSIAVDQ